LNVTSKGLTVFAAAAATTTTFAAAIDSFHWSYSLLNNFGTSHGPCGLTTEMGAVCIYQLASNYSSSLSAVVD